MESVPPPPRQIRKEAHNLVVVAAPTEWDAVAPRLGIATVPPTIDTIGTLYEPNAPDTHWTLMRCGVGKTMAAVITQRALSTHTTRRVVSIGIAGALPPRAGIDPLPIGTVVVATRCLFADEGVQAPDRFVPLNELGFGVDLANGECNLDCAPHDQGMANQLLDLLTDAASRRGSAIPRVAAGPIATVSTCAGTDQIAMDRALRTGALCEAMEGAAVVLAAHWNTVPAIEIRVISNTTGDRHSQVWNVERALRSLAEVASVIASIPD